MEPWKIPTGEGWEETEEPMSATEESERQAADQGDWYQRNQWWNS